MSMSTVPALALGDLKPFLEQDDVVVLDVRPTAEYVAAHVRGTANAPYRRRHYAEAIADQISPAEFKLVTLGANEITAQAAAEDLAAQGFKLLGYAYGTPEEWEGANLVVDRLEEWDADTLKAKLGSEPGLEVIDVREPFEWNSGHIQGARHIPLDDLEDRLSELDPEKPYAIICASGNRSSYATQVLQAHGFKRPINIRGGIYDWMRRGHEVVR